MTPAPLPEEYSCFPILGESGHFVCQEGRGDDWPLREPPAAVGNRPPVSQRGDVSTTEPKPKQDRTHYEYHGIGWASDPLRWRHDSSRTYQRRRAVGLRVQGGWYEP